MYRDRQRTQPAVTSTDILHLDNMKNHPLDVALALVIFLGVHLLALLIDLTAPAAQPTAPRPAIRAAIHRAPLTVEALIAAHTQRELMAMAGTRSKRSKKFLAEKILKN
jgi:hypothetical protein